MSHSWEATVSVATGVRRNRPKRCEKGGEDLHHLDWFEVTEIRGHFTDETIGHFQVTMKVGFRLDDDE